MTAIREQRQLLITAPPTISEFADLADAAVSTVWGWHKKWGHPTLGESVRKRNGRNVYPRIRKQGTRVGGNGHRLPTLNPADCQEVLDWLSVPRLEEGRVWCDDSTARAHDCTVEQLRSLARRGIADAKLHDRRMEWRGHRRVKRYSFDEEQLNAYFDARSDASPAQDGYLTIPDFSAKVKYDPSVVFRWAITNKHCPLLNRPLNVLAGDHGDPALVGTVKPQSHRPGQVFHCYWIADADADRIYAVDRVWIDLMAIAKELKVCRESLGARKKRIPRIGQVLSFDNCRKFGCKGGWEYRLHASVVVALAKALRKPAIAGKYKKRLRKKIGSGNNAKTAEQLAAEALAHWKPDEETPETDTTPDHPEQPIPTPKQAGGGTKATQKPKRRRVKSPPILVGGQFLKERQVDLLIFVRDSTTAILEKHIAEFCDQERVGGTLRTELNQLYEIRFLLRGETGWHSPGIRITPAAVEALAALN